MRVQDVLFLAAMGPPGGGRTAITPRYVRHFHVLALTDSSDATLKHIFSTVQVWHTPSAFPVHASMLLPPPPLPLELLLLQVLELLLELLLPLLVLVLALLACLLM